MSEPPAPRPADPTLTGQPGPRPARDQAFSPGQSLAGRYELRRRLGEGGMGEVWQAFDLKLRVEVALKSLHREREAQRGQELLRGEVRAAREVVSPNVCRVFDLVAVEDRELLSMEYVDGETVLERMRNRGPLELREAGEIAFQLLAGLGAIHRAGFVHRDLKPENVMLTRTGRVLVMDFGLAREDSAERGGSISGTPAYMAPEQSRGEAVDARTDVFAAGLVLAEMIGTDGSEESRAALWAGVREEPVRLPTSAWEPVLLRALQKEPAARPATAEALARALEEVTLRGRSEDERPYPGLASFGESDAQHFHGREAEVEAVLAKLQRQHLLGLIGPSGAGKSSFLRAGLLPALPAGWSAIVCHPGEKPFVSLARALAPELAGDTEALREVVDLEELDVAVSAVGRWRKRHAEVLLVVDQFEELFTLNRPDVQAGFAELLGRLALEGDVRVLLSMRDDFLFHCHAHPALAPITSELTLLGPPEGEALRRALVQPALTCGYRFEDDALVDEMLEEVNKERGALPMLAFSALRLWERREREEGLLTRAAYEGIGGVGGALAQHAEATLERVGPEREGVVRELFRNLVTAQGTRVARDRDELLSVFEDRATAEEVLGALVDARLLTSFESEAPAVEEREEKQRHRIEIVHESLLSAWPRLVRWQTQDADGALLRDQLRQAARTWDERGRSTDLLWSGSAYREFQVWRERYPGGLTETEDAFARAMAEHAGRKRRHRRLATAAGFAVLAVGLGTIAALWRQSEASRQETVSEAQRAESSKLLALAQLRLEKDPTEALAYTTASLELADTREARAFTMKVLWQAPPALELVTEDGFSPYFSHDGKRLATGGLSERVRVWSEEGGKPLVLGGHEVNPKSGIRPLWTEDGLLVTGTHPSAQTRRVHVWSIPEGKRLRTIDLGKPTRWDVGTNHLLGYTREEGSDPGRKVWLLRRWLLPGGEPEYLGRVDLTALGASTHRLAPNGQGWLYTKGRSVYFRPLPAVDERGDRVIGRHDADARIERWDTELGRLLSFDSSGEIRLWSFPPQGPKVDKVVVKPETAPGPYPDVEGRWITSLPFWDRQLRLWDTGAWRAARPLALRRSGSWYGSEPAFHPPGDWIVASTHASSRQTFWPLRGTYPVVVDGYSSKTRPLAFSPDGRWLATSWEGSRLRLWPLPGSGNDEVRPLDLPEEVRAWRSLVFDPRGRYLFAAGGQNRAYVVSLDGSPPRKLPGAPVSSPLAAGAVSPSGRLVATAFWFGQGEKTLRVYDVETGELRTFDLPDPANGASPAGERSAGGSGFERGVKDLHFADESTLYTAGHGGIRRWDLRNGTHDFVLDKGADVRTAMAILGGGRTALTSDVIIGRRDTCRPAELHDLTSGESRELPAYGSCVRQWALDGSGEVVVTGDVEGVVRVGKISGGEPHLLVGG